MTSRGQTTYQQIVKHGDPTVTVKMNTRALVDALTTVHYKAERIILGLTGKPFQTVPEISEIVEISSVLVESVGALTNINHALKVFDGSQDELDEIFAQMKTVALAILEGTQFNPTKAPE